MANSDDVALLKEELAQFLLTEISSAQGGAAFRREVGDQVGAVIDQILDARLKPALETLDRQAAEHRRQTTATLDEALARLKAAVPTGDSSAADRKLVEMSAALEQLRQRVARAEETPKPARLAVAQPMQAPGRAALADERIAAPGATVSSLPRWIFWLMLLLLALSVLGLGNLYYDKLNRPEPAAPLPLALSPPSTTSLAAPAPPPAALTSPPQSAAATAPPPAQTPAVTPIPAPVPPVTTPAQPAARYPADVAIERGWLAAQPYAVEPRLARHLGSNETLPTLRSIVCGRAANCTSDALLSGGMAGGQLVVLQMLMSQIGDRFCAPRRSVAVTGLVSAAGLADLAAIATCAGGAPAHCSETQNRVCAPASDALQSGSQAAQSALLRWALWKTGST